MTTQTVENTGQGHKVILPPLFAAKNRGEVLHTPNLNEVLSEWLDSINFLLGPTHAFAAVMFAFHTITFIVTIFYFIYFISLNSFLFALGAVLFQSTIYNTVWFHRYCAHASFKFRSVQFTKIFLWTAPFMFREEIYAIPHQIHHQNPEKVGDPYGPHLGWLGNYLAIESTHKYNLGMSEFQYESVARSIQHIGLKTNSYEQFRRTGSFEKPSTYFSRMLFAQLFYVSLAYLIGGVQYVMAWYVSIFLTVFLIRDFNWRGHGGRNSSKGKRSGWEFDDKSKARNQYFYGYLASEWHDNHHMYPMSAKNGFLPGQVDLAFLIIKFFSKIGMVESYTDMTRKFKERFAPRISMSLSNMGKNIQRGATGINRITVGE